MTDVRPTLVDLLCDGDADATSWSVQDVEDTVRRDLHALLNTRRWCMLPFGELEADCADTGLAYGVAPIDHLSLNDPNVRRVLRQRIARVVETFEPRLCNVRISDVEAGHGGVLGAESTVDALLQRTLTFHIRADLILDGGTARVEFETHMDPLGPGFFQQANR